MSVLRNLMWPGLATLVALAILLSLGFWQLGRLQQKAAQLNALDSAIAGTPTPLDANAVLTIRVEDAGAPNAGGVQFAELTRVAITGAFLPARSVPVRATLPSTKGSPTSGIGFFWMTPLQLASGEVIFVNRGFVPSGGDWKAPAVATPEGSQKIVGLIRMAERPRLFTPADNAAKGEFFSRDPQAMARYAGIEPARVANFFIDAERTPNGLTPPLGVDAREMIARIPNNHLQYAVTWFAFAVTLLGVFGFFARARLRETAKEKQ